MASTEFGTFDQLSGLVIALARDGTIVHWNRACSQLTGLALEDLRGVRWENLVLPEDASRSNAAMATLAPEQPSTSFECTWVLESGVQRIIAFSCSLVEHEEPLVLLTGVDVTASVTEREAGLVRLQALLEQAPDAIFVADPAGNYTDVNEAGCKLLGYSREDILGMKIIDILPAEDIDRLWESHDDLVKGQVHMADWHLRRADGSLVDAEVSAKILPDGRWQGFVRDITERKRLEASLRESLDDLRRAQAVAKIGSWRLDVPTDQIRWSEETYRIFGMPLGSRLTYEDFLGRVHPGDRARVDELWLAALRGKPYDIEHRILVDGEVTWVRERADFELDESGIPVRGTGVVQDITEQKLDAESRRITQERLVLSEQRLRIALQTSPASVWNQDTELRYTWVHNPRGRFAASEILGRTDFDLLPHSEALRLERLKRAVLETGQGSREIVSISFLGDILYYDMAIEPLRDDTGRIIGITGAVWDITDQRHAEMEQRFLAQLGATLMRVAPDSQATLSAMADLAVQEIADWFLVDVVEANQIRRAKVTCSLRDQESLVEALEGVHLSIDLPHLMAEALRDRKPTLVPEVTREYLESRAQSPEHLELLQAMMPRSLLSVPLIARDRSLGAFTIILSSEERSYRERDLRFAQEIARVAALALDNAQLFEAAQQAIAARNVVLGVVAHDLRSPLHAILLQTQIMDPRTEESDRRILSPIHAIQRAAQRMNRLIQDMLDITLLEAGEMSMEHSVLDARTLLDEACDTQCQAAANAGIRVLFDAPEDLPDVRGDHDRLMQVLDNLLSNAIKFTQAGGTITVGAMPRDGELLFWVKDNGKGMSPEELSHVFERFWRGATTDRRGVGLGLPIVKGILEGLGGRVWAESQVGRGTTIYFTVPVARPAEAYAPAVM